MTQENTEEPQRLRRGPKTPDTPVLNGGLHQVNATLPKTLYDRLPSGRGFSKLIHDAILRAPPCSELPEPLGAASSYSRACRMPPEVYDAFEEKRGDYRRGAYLRRIMQWEWGVKP